MVQKLFRVLMSLSVLVGMCPLGPSLASAQITPPRRQVNVFTDAATINLNETHDIVLVFAETTASEVRLPDVLSTIPDHEGRHYTIKKIDTTSNAVTIKPAIVTPTQKIDDQNEYVLLTKDQEVRIVGHRESPTGPAYWKVIDALPKGTLDVTTFPGADAGAKLNASAAALPCPGGGVLDGRGFGATSQTISSDPFEKPAVSITSTSRASNVVTVTTSDTHTFLAGETVDISGVTGGATPFNGTFCISSVTSSTVFKYKRISASTPAAALQKA